MPSVKEEMIKIPKKVPKKMPVYSKTSGLDITKKGNQERTNDYTVSSSRNDKFYEEAERKGVAKKPNFQNLAAGGSVFKLKDVNSPMKCWKTHKKVGMKKSPSGRTKNGKIVMVNDCKEK